MGDAETRMFEGTPELVSPFLLLVALRLGFHPLLVCVIEPVSLSSLFMLAFSGQEKCTLMDLGGFFF